MPTQEKTISSDGKSTIRIKIAGVGGGGISVLKGVAEEELSESIELAAINTAIMKLKEHISDDANLIWGYLGDHASDGNVRVMLIATDFLRN